MAEVKRLCARPILVQRAANPYLSFSCTWTTALSSLWLSFAQRQILSNGMIKLFPSLVREYSTARDLDLVVTCLAISPQDSRLRRVRVSIRCETLPKPLRNCPWRHGPFFNESMIFTVHLPMKIVGSRSDPGLIVSTCFGLPLEVGSFSFEAQGERRNTSVPT